jgi:hypothetical protein
MLLCVWRNASGAPFRWLTCCFTDHIGHATTHMALPEGEGCVELNLTSAVDFGASPKLQLRDGVKSTLEALRRLGPAAGGGRHAARPDPHLLTTIWAGTLASRALFYYRLTLNVTMGGRERSGTPAPAFQMTATICLQQDAAATIAEDDGAPDVHAAASATQVPPAHPPAAAEGLELGGHRRRAASQKFEGGYAEPRKRAAPSDAVGPSPSPLSAEGDADGGGQRARSRRTRARVGEMS